MNARKVPYRTVFLYLLIPLALYMFSVFLPLVVAGFYSLFEWKGGPNKTFIGLDNYVALLNDATFRLSVNHNLILVGLCVVGQVGIAIIFVGIISNRFIRFKKIHRTFGFFPSTISAVYVGFIWTMIYDSRRGLLNHFLEAIGQHDLTQVWLNNSTWIMLIVSIPLIWQYIGYYMLILLSALSSIDQEIIESAEIDGANTFQRTTQIVLPMIKSTIYVCLILCVSGNMKAFDNIYVMTSGGPGNDSMVMALYGYRVSFVQQNMGYGSSISVGIFVIGLIVIGAMQLIFNRSSRE